MKQTTTLRLVLGDQLNPQHSWFKTVDPSVTYVLMEVKAETNQVVHHIQKVVGFFAAMRAFAEELTVLGHRVEYWKLDHPKNQQSFTSNLDELQRTLGFSNFEYQEPEQYELDQALVQWCLQHPELISKQVSSEHFLAERFELRDFFKGKKQTVMEFFYRYMRKKHDVLMVGDQPLNGKWNFDADNRNKMPEKHVAPAPLLFDHDVSEIVVMLEKMQIKTMGFIHANHFTWPVNRSESLALLSYFCEHLLVNFGTFQDAMTPHQWSLYHSRISFSMNAKMIHPKEVIDQVVATWAADPDKIAFHQVEGFVRQIIGWREFMRGMYWREMPEFKISNYFNHSAKLPEWYWTGKTKMHCLKHSISQSLEQAYAHHIQRLMVTGNFALLLGVHPDEVDAWYLGIYADALEWVEITNTRGMSQFADGGQIATKPYVSSASYVNKMSSYCKTCFYDHKEKLGEKACPFNALYWDFYDRNTHLLGNNFRMGMMYKVWEKMPIEQRTAIIEKAASIKATIDSL